MPAGDLVTNFYQYEYNGVVLGDGTPFYVSEISDLLGYPSVRSGTVDRFGNHGAIAGRHYLPKREFVLEFDYTPVSDNDFSDKRTQLMQAFAPVSDPQGEKPFVFWHPGDSGKMYINARPKDYDFPLDRSFALMNPRNFIRFEASDPRHYSIEEFSFIINLVPDTTGLTFALTFPLNFGPATGNSASAFNGGTSPASWSAVITGQVNGPRMEKVGTGEELNLPNLNIEAGQTLEINEKLRSIKLNGEASRRSYLTKASRWFKLDPGASTTIRYSANGATSGSSLTFKWRHAFWGES